MNKNDIPEIIAELKKGKMVIILDDEDLYEFREYFNDPTSLNIN